MLLLKFVKIYIAAGRAAKNESLIVVSCEYMVLIVCNIPQFVIYNCPLGLMNFDF